MHWRYKTCTYTYITYISRYILYIYMYSIYTHTYNIYIYIIYTYIYVLYTYLQYIWKHQYLKPPTVSTTSHCHLWVSPTTERSNTKPTTPRRVGLKPTTQVHSELAHLLGLNPQQPATLGVRILRFDPWSCKHHSYYPSFIHHLSILSTTWICWRIWRQQLPCRFPSPGGFANGKIRTAFSKSRLKKWAFLKIVGGRQFDHIWIYLTYKSTIQIDRLHRQTLWHHPGQVFVPTTFDANALTKTRSSCPQPQKSSWYWHILPSHTAGTGLARQSSQVLRRRSF